MRYPAKLATEGPYTLADFYPYCPGCQTFAETKAGPGEQDIVYMATDALAGWLECHLQDGELPPRPPHRKPRGRILWVDVPPHLSAKLSLRWARADAGLTQLEVAKRAKVSQQMIAKIEHPDRNVTVDTLVKVARALGVKLTIEFQPMSEPERRARPVRPARADRFDPPTVARASGRFRLSPPAPAARRRRAPKRR